MNQRRKYYLLGRPTEEGNIKSGGRYKLEKKGLRPALRATNKPYMLRYH